jgi:uncharacterized protein YjbJ (UPF0337 family)
MGNATGRKPNTVGEEASAFGERVKGAVKEGAGAVTGNESLKHEGRVEREEGRQRQAANQVFTGTFRDADSADRAYRSMLDRGYTNDDINLMMSEDTRKKYFSGQKGATEIGTKAAEDAGKGAAVGGAIGATIAAIAAIGSSVIFPGLGVVVAGPLLAGLAGAGAGGATGGLIGYLVGKGIPEERARLYENDIKNGGIVMGFNPRSDEDADYFEREWKNYRAENIYR